MKIAVFLRHPRVPCWNFSAANRQRLQTSLPTAQIAVCEDREHFLRELGNAEVAIVWRFKQEWFASAPRLRLLATPAAGRDYFQVTPPPQVAMRYGSFHGEIMAETVLGMMLCHCRGLLYSERLRHKHPWPDAELSQTMRPLRNSHVAILGFGHIGEWISRLAKPFGVRITGIKRQLALSPPYFTTSDRIVTVEYLHDVLPSVDHLVLVLPSDTGTDRIIGRREIELLPPTAAIYNVGRGNAIDEEALYEALTTGRLAAAYLDVFSEEPLPASSPLRQCPSLFIMPHASAISLNYLDLFLNELIHDLQALAADIS